jgi:hypothetical protein
MAGSSGEFLYTQSGVLIAAGILALLVLAIEAGTRLGLRSATGTTEASRSQINTVQGSVVGVLALMLGFTFSIALERFNSRSVALVDEANAIGTARLRTELLPEAFRRDAACALDRYIGLRVDFIALPTDRGEERERTRAETLRMHTTLWAQAAEAARTQPNPVTTGLYVQAINEVIDSFGRNSADIERHVPEFALLLLFGAFITAGGVIGYSAGVAGHRPAAATYLMIGLIVVLMLLIMDLDRPRRGVIHVDMTPLLELRNERAPDCGAG